MVRRRRFDFKSLPQEIAADIVDRIDHPVDRLALRQTTLRRYDRGFTRKRIHTLVKSIQALVGKPRGTYLLIKKPWTLEETIGLDDHNDLIIDKKYKSFFVATLSLNHSRRDVRSPRLKIRKLIDILADDEPEMESFQYGRKLL